MCKKDKIDAGSLFKREGMFQYKNTVFVGYGLFKHTGLTFQASVQFCDAFRSPVPTHKNVSDQRLWLLFKLFNYSEHSNVGHFLWGSEVQYWTW